MSDLDDAAHAFDADMGGTRSAARTTNNDGPTERMLSTIGDVENPDEPAGGDALPIEGVDDGEGRSQKQQLRTRRQIEEPEEDEDPDAALYEEEEPEDKDAEEDEQSDDLTDDEDEPEDEEDKGPIVRLPVNARIRVMVDGKPAIINAKEFEAGIIRVKTFHQRLAKVNDAKKLIEQEAGKLLADRKNVLEIINTYGDAIKALVPKEPNWDELYATDPKQARLMQKNYEGLQQTLNQLFAARQKIINDADADSQRRTAQFAADEQEKFEALNPAWSTDPARKQKDLVAMVRTGLSQGFTAEELDATYDSRMLDTLLKASKYDRIVASRPKPDRRGKTPVNPGAGNRGVRGTAPRGRDAANRQLAKTGSVEDAASVFKNLIR